ncbi:MAG: replicative DNA helicase, partial [Clostridium sp.]|nr:replicative DNA helicase [Clostridium sp.]
MAAEDNLLKRVLPSSSEAEQSVIGSMLMDREAVIAASEILTGADFYQKLYGVMFDSMVELFNENQPIDLVTLQNRLKEKDVPPEAASLETIRDIMSAVPTSVNVRSYAEIVHDKAVERRLIRVAEEIENMCYAGKDRLEDILDATEKDIFGILEKRTAGALVPIRQVAMNVLEKIEAASRSNSTVTGVPSGFIDLDYRTAGFQPSDFILVAARPSMGKTAFVLNIVQHVAMKKRMNALIFSLEMSKEQLANRLLSMESGVDAQKLRTGSLSDADWDSVVEGVGVIGNSGIMIDDTPGISISEMRTKCRKLMLEKGFDIIIIDYLQLMSGSGRGHSGESRQQEISEISRSLKALAREMNVPVIALSQLSRACEQRPDHRPMLSDLRDSGAIEQDADVVMFLYRDDYYHKDTENPNVAEVIVAKQ